MGTGRLLRHLTAGVALAAAAPAAAHAQAQRYVPADWTGVEQGVAGGTLNGTSISLSGSDVNPDPASRTDGSADAFDRDDFTPRLERSDAIHFQASPGGAYELSFGAPVTDPILHLGSLAGTLSFPEGTQISRVSGDAQLAVSGHEVRGRYEPPTDDGNGTVRLHGSFGSLPFRATYEGADGIYLQVGVLVDAPPEEPPPPPPPPPPAPDTTITRPFPQPPVIWVTAPQFSFVSSIAGSRFECRVDDGAWAPCVSPHRTADLASGPHVFEARAISPEGVADETPSSRRFEVAFPDRERLVCHVQPVHQWPLTLGKRDWRLTQTGCQIAGDCAGKSDIWLGQLLCRREPVVCPRGARCTVTTTGRWFDADRGLRWELTARNDVGRTRYDIYQLASSSAVGTCRTGPDDDRCVARAKHTAIGTGRPVLFMCNASIVIGTVTLEQGAFGTHPALGPDGVRRIECEAEMLIEPAQPLQAAASGTTVQIATPAPGILHLIATTLPTAGAARDGARRGRPAFAAVRRQVSGDGPAAIALRPNAAARRLLRRGRRLPVRLDVTFTDGEGAVTRSTQRVTVTRPRPRERVCRAKRPRSAKEALRRRCR